jgi:hypothetical protein
MSPRKRSSSWIKLEVNVGSHNTYGPGCTREVEKPPAKPLGIKGIAARVLLAVIPLALTIGIHHLANWLVM